MPVISGTVYDDSGAPAVGRTVRIYRRDTGALLGSCFTGPADAVPADASFSNVSALLPMTGPDGSTTFTDIKGKVWTAAGGAQISTAHSFFGGGVGYFDGDARITTPHAADLAFVSGDFTIEFMVRFAVIGVNHVIVNRGLGTGAFPYQIWVDSSNRFGFRCFNASSSLDINILGGSAATGIDYFVCARRSGSTFSLHVNDVLIGTGTSAANRLGGTLPVSIGAYSDGVAGFMGYLGQLRITAGVVRPTSVPTDSWPLSENGAPALISGEYYADVAFSGEAQRIVLDDDAGTLHNDLIDRVMLT